MIGQTELACPYTRRRDPRRAAVRPGEAEPRRRRDVPGGGVDEQGQGGAPRRRLRRVQEVGGHAQPHARDVHRRGLRQARTATPGLTDRPAGRRHRTRTGTARGGRSPQAKADTNDLRVDCRTCIFAVVSVYSVFTSTCTVCTSFFFFLEKKPELHCSGALPVWRTVYTNEGSWTKEKRHVNDDAP